MRSSLLTNAVAYLIGVCLASTVTALSAYRLASSALSDSQAGPSASMRDEARASSRPTASPVSLRSSPQTPVPNLAARKTLPRFAQAYRTPYAYYGERNYHYRYEEPEDDEDHDYRGGDRSPGYSRRSGAFTTLCVRLCDGYYFPISFSVSRSRFERDAQTCERSCPGQARLFVQSNPGGEVDGSMVDLSGKPYRDLKTAFLYRAENVPSCRCKPDPWDPVARQQHRVYALEAAARNGDAKAKAELAELMAKMKSERAAQNAASTPQANAPARVADAPPSEAPRRRSHADDTTERMGLGGRRESRERPSPSWARETDWIARALGLR